MNKLLLSAVLLIQFLLFGNQSARAALAQGDLAIIGHNCDPSTSLSKTFAVVALADIVSGEVIYFSDKAYYANAFSPLLGNGSEGRFSWTIPSGGVAKGTVIMFTLTSGASPSVTTTPSTGTTSIIEGWTSTSSTVSPFGQNGDNILIYQGTEASPTFIFGYNSGNNTTAVVNGWNTGLATNPNAACELPSTLIAGTTAIGFNNVSGYSNFDNLSYNGTQTGTKAALLTAICTASNWIHDNDTNSYDLTPGTGVFTGSQPIFTIGSGNIAPVFLNSSPQSLSICQNASATSLISLLHVSDASSSQTMTWTQQSAPTNGTITITSATASSGSTDITPGGTITYTPTNGYNGTDQFTIRVSDGIATADMVINVTVNALPTITLGSNPSICNGSTVANLTYSSTTNSPNQYSIAWSAGAIIAGFTNLSNTSLPASPIALTAPSNPGAGTYTGTLRVINSTTGCSSTGSTMSVTVNALPTITLGSNPSICNGTTSANLTYSSTTSSPNQYSISWSAGAIIAGFTNLSNTSLPASPIALTAPSNPGAGTYTGTLRVINSTTGCSSTGSTMSVTVNALPTITLGSNPSICNGTTSANLTYSSTTSSPNQYSISWSAGAIIAGFTNLSNTSLPASPIALTAPSNPGAGTYTGTLRVINSTTGCSSTGSSMSVTVNALPSITLGSVSSVNTAATSFSLPYSATTGSPDQYSITTGTNAMPSFSAVSNASLPASPISVTIPASAISTYDFVASVKNSTTGCISANNNFTLNVVTAATITATGTLSAFTTCAGVVSAEQSFTVSGSNLTANLVITPPTGFEASTTSGSGFTTSVSLTPSSGSVSSTTIYVRLTTAATGSPSGNFTVASSGGTTQNVAASGTVSAAIATNSFTSPQTICSGAIPTGFTGSTPTGGTGSYSYLWLSSTTSNSAGFSAANGTNNTKDYSPGATTQSTWYKRVVSSGTCNNDTSLLTTNGVYALTFNGSTGNGGSSGYVSIAGGTPAAIQGSGNKYVGMWVYPTSTNTGGLFNFGNSGACYATTRLILLGGFLRIDQGCGVVTTTISVPQNQWTYVFVSFNSSTQYTVGKVSNGTVTKQNVLTSTSASHGSGAFNIGANTINGQYFTGQMDEVSIWSKNPTDAEIVSMSQNGLTGSEASLVGYWNFNAGPVNTTVTDNSGHSLTGTLVNVNSTSGWVPSTLTLSAPTTITVNPVPSVSNATTASICSGISPNISLTASVASSFAWTLGTNTGSITGASASNGASINQTLTNPSNSSAGSIVYTVTPTATTGSCVGNPTDITVNVNPKPTITLGTVNNVNTTATSFSLPYSATAGSPDQYSITTGTSAMPSFSAVSNASLPASPISVTIPASAANTYDFIATVKNSTTGCISANNNFTLTTSSSTTVSSINRGTPSAASTNATSVTYNVTFGSSVTGVTASNFSLTTSGVTGASIGTVSGSGTSWTVEVNTGSGDGSITLNLDNASGMSPGISTSMPFAGQTYTIDKTAPTVVAQNITAQLNSSGTVVITSAQVDDGSTDASGIDSMSVSPSSFTCANVGANTVTLTVTDNSGNSNTAIATVTIADTISPVATSQNITRYLNAAGTVSITASQVNNGSTDACGIASLSISPSSFTCANVGANTVTLTVTDNNGNVKTTTATITVLDTVRPVVVTQNRTVYLNAAGTATVSALQLNNGSSDACGVASLSSSQTSFTCANVGTPVTVTLTATDLNGNSNTGTATVTVLDTVRPVVVTQNRTVYLSAAGTATVSALQLNNGSSDACGVASLSSSQTSFTCANVGTPVTVTLTATDLNGNSNTGTATVTVLDTVRPVVVTQNRTVYLSAAGTATVSALQLNNGTSDACGVASLSSSQTSFTCANVGTPVTVTLTATDLNGNSNTGTATVTVLDTVRPVVVTQNRTVYLNAAGTATVSALQLNNGTSDACGVASLSSSQTSFTCANVGTPVTVTLTATDLNGNSNTGTATVTVLDTVRPVVVTQNRTVYLSAAGTATVSALQLNNGTSDACGVASLSSSQTSFTCANVGTPVTVTLTATDLNGNSNTGTATVTVLDTVRPVVNTQNRTVYLSAAGTATVSALQLNNGTSDACGVASLSASQTSFTCANVGTPVTVTLTATDLNGNSNTGTATVTVLDTVRPVVVTQNRTVYLNAAGTATVSALQLNNGTSDACGVASLSSSQTSFTCANVGTPVTVTLTATDLNGNSNTGTATVTVLDTVRPVVNTQNRTVYLNAAGTATVSALQLNNGTSDACGVASLSSSQTSFTCANVGTPVTVTLTATDLNGNSNTGTATVTVLDTVRPVVVTQNRTVYLNAAGTATVSALQLNNGSSDACGVASLSSSQTSFTCANVGTPVTVTLTATDLNGNSNTGTATVTVLDTVRPVVVTQNRTVYLSAAGTATVSALQLNNGTSDACGVASLSSSQTSFTCANVGTPVTVTLTATDLNGNSNTGTATVTVLDTVRPVVVTQNRTVYLNAAGTATVSAGQVNNGSTDACGVAALSLSQTSFTCANVGSNTVTLTVTDVNSNSKTGTATVTVLDTVRPVVNTQNRTVYLSAAGTATVSALQLNNGTSDACGVASLSSSQTSFTCANVGTPVTVTLTATDLNGNSNTGTATVTVLDTVRPVVNTQNRTVYLNAAGTATVSALQLNNGTSDACGVASLSSSQTSFTCANVGTPVTVTLTATDLNGNSNTGTATVTVLDTIRPVVVCKVDTIILDGTGNGSTTALRLTQSATDNCSIVSSSISKSTFNTSNIGSNSVVLSVTDAAGNISSCTTTVVVIEPKPVAICQNKTIYINPSGTATLVVNDIDNGSYSLVGLSNRTISKSTFTCADLGVNSVKLVVTNIFNTSDSCTATVTVLDTLKPVIVKQNITAYLAADGNVSITAASVNNGSSDNCSISTLRLSKTSFDCTNLGGNSVWFIVTDNSGNKDSVQTTVTVLDTIKPTIQSKSNVVLYLTSNGTLPITSSILDNGSYDNCDVDSVYLSQPMVSCNDLGVKKLALTVVDQSNNSTTDSVSVVVLDPIAPIARPKSKVIVYLSTNGQVVINPLLIDSASTDNCTITSRILSQTVFTCAQMGLNTVTFTVQDQSGNSSFATAQVEVRDTIKPNVIVSNQTLYLNAAGIATTNALLVNNNSTDNCGIDSVWISKTNFTCSDVGTSNMSLFVRDINGNVNSALVSVTLFDTIRPMVRAKQGIVAYLNASGAASITANQVDSLSGDNCSLASLSINKTSFTCADLGNNTLTLQGTDVNGNSNSYTFNVLVRDTIKPSLTVANTTVYLNAIGSASVSAQSLVAASADNCGTPVITANTTSFSCANRGANTVVVTATDASGNSVIANTTVTVLDTIKPTVVAQNITAYLNATGNVSITTTQANNGSSDNCGIVSYSLSKTNFTGADLGLNTVSLIAIDASGNSSSIGFTLTIVDTVRPIALVQNVSVYLNAAGMASITAATVNNGSTDNVGVSTLSVSKTTFTCSDIGSNSIVLTVTDASNNSSTVSTTVMVYDTIKPVALGQNITTYLNGIGIATITPVQVNNNSSDNCTVTSTTLSKTTFTCDTKGANTVVLTATDASGNTSTTNVTVTVLDTIKPNVVVNNNLNLYLNALGTVGLSTLQVNNGSSDNCSIASLALSKTSFNATELGLRTVLFTVTDASGNSSSVNVNVTVLDTVRPVVSTINKTIYLNQVGQASVSASQVNNGSTDNVGVVGLTLSKYTYNCSELGVNAITFQATDASGNIGSGIVQITVLDTIKPQLVIEPGNMVFGKCGAKVNFTIPPVIDNCGQYTITQTAGIPNGGIYPVGTTVNTFTIADLSGNSITTSFSVTILPSYLPVTFKNLEMCSNGSAVDLSQSKDSLVFTGSGVLTDGITFDPHVSGAGNHLINYIFTDSMGCANEGSFMITVFSSPETPAVDRVNSTTLKVREVFDSYQWYYNNQPYAGHTKQTINVARSGIYYVVVKNSKGCAAISVPIGIGVQVGLGVIEDKANFMVYPNPNSGRFTLEYNKPVTVKEPARVIITDLLGKEIYQTEVSTAIMDIDLSEIAPGTYYVRMIQGDAVTVKPIVIKN